MVDRKITKSWQTQKTAAEKKNSTPKKRNKNETKMEVFTEKIHLSLDFVFKIHKHKTLAINNIQR